MQTQSVRRQTFSPPRPENAFAPQSTDEADGAFESNLTRLTFFRKKNSIPHRPRGICDRGMIGLSLSASFGLGGSTPSRRCSRMYERDERDKMGRSGCWFPFLQVGLAPEDFAPRWHYLGRGTFSVLHRRRRIAGPDATATQAAHAGNLGPPRRAIRHTARRCSRTPALCAISRTDRASAGARKMRHNGIATNSRRCGDRTVTTTAQAWRGRSRRPISSAPTCRSFPTARSSRPMRPFRRSSGRSRRHSI